MSYNNPPKGFYALDDKHDVRDWLPQGADIDFSSIQKQKVVNTEINQSLTNLTKSSCTIAGAYLQLCQIWDKKATMEELKELVNYCINEFGYKEGEGRYTSLAINSVRKWRNEKYPNKKVFSLKFTKDNPYFEMFVEKGFLLGATYNGNSAYNRDRDDNGVVDANSFGKSTYGHRLNIGYSLIGNTVEVQDTYHGRATNIYKLSDIHKLVYNGVYYPNFYVFLKEERSLSGIEQIKEKQKTAKKFNALVNLLSHLWSEMNYEEQELASDLALKLRSRFDFEKINKDHLKFPAVVKDVVASYIVDVPEVNRELVIDTMMKLGLES